MQVLVDAAALSALIESHTYYLERFVDEFCLGDEGQREAEAARALVADLNPRPHP